MSNHIRRSQTATLDESAQDLRLLGIETDFVTLVSRPAHVRTLAGTDVVRQAVNLFLCYSSYTVTAQIGLRLTLGNTFITILPATGATYAVEVTNVLGQPVSEEERRTGLEYALVNVSALRQQLFEMLGRKVPTMKAEK